MQSSVGLAGLEGQVNATIAFAESQTAYAILGVEWMGRVGSEKLGKQQQQETASNRQRVRPAGR